MRLWRYVFVALAGRQPADAQVAKTFYPLMVPNVAKAQSVAEDGRPTHRARPSNLWLGGMAEATATKTYLHSRNNRVYDASSIFKLEFEG